MSIIDTKIATLEKQVATLSAKLANLQNRPTSLVEKLATKPDAKPKAKGTFKIASKKGQV